MGKIKAKPSSALIFCILIILVCASSIFISFSDELAAFFKFKSGDISKVAKEFIVSASTVIGVGALIELIKEFLVREKVKGYVRKCFESLYITVNGFNEKIEGFQNSGLVKINLRGGMDSKNLFKKSADGDKVFWLDTHDPNYSSWKDDVREAATRGVKIKFLIMDPKSDALEMRARELDNHSSFQGEQTIFNAKIREIRDSLDKRHQKNIEIREYEDLPCAPIFILETQKKIFAWSSYYLNVPTSVNMPHFWWECSPFDNACGCMTHYLKKYFMHKWEYADNAYESKIYPIGFWVYKFDLTGC